MRTYLATIVVALSTGGVAVAADMPVKAPPAPVVATGAFFGYLQGWYAVEPGDVYGQFPNTAPLNSGLAGPGSGAGGAALLGYRFPSAFDISVGAQYTGFGAGPADLFPACTGTTQMTRAGLFAADADVGYNFGGMGSSTRLYLGPRYFQWTHHLTDTCNVRQNDATTWGAGPHGGFDFSTKLSPSWGFTAGANGSILFGTVRDATTLGTVDENRTIYQVGGYAGFDWMMAPLWKFSVGYKVDYWSGIHSNQCCGASTGVGGGSRDMLDHGPFGRISYNFGAQ